MTVADLPWFEIALPVKAHEVDAATGKLAAHGYGSTELRERADDVTELVVYARSDDAATANALAAELSRRIAPTSTGQARVTELEERSWTESWKQHFPPLHIGRRLRIVPPWEVAGDRGSGIVTVRINPAMAFGTGHHETTASCLELVERLVGSGFVVADVGCGSGVLAIAALLLGAERAIAVDTDREAIDAARANAELNDVADRLDLRLVAGDEAIPTDAAVTGTVPGGAGFDLVIANIYAETLIRLRDRLTSCVKDGGFLVLSGIEGARATLVEKTFVGEVWPIMHQIHRGEWLTVCLQKLPR